VNNAVVLKWLEAAIPHLTFLLILWVLLESRTSRRTALWAAAGFLTAELVAGALLLAFRALRGAFLIGIQETEGSWPVLLFLTALANAVHTCEKLPEDKRQIKLSADFSRHSMGEPEFVIPAEVLDGLLVQPLILR